MSKHTQQAIQEMDAKASSGRHAPKPEEEAENRGKHVTGKMAEVETAEEFPSTMKGKHADEKGTYAANAEKYASRSKEARRRKLSIIISASIAVVGTIVGLGLLGVSSHIDEQEGADVSQSDAVLEDEATFVGRPHGNSIVTEEEQIVFSDSASDTAITEEFLEQEELAKRQAPLESGAPENSVEAELDQFGGYEISPEDILALSGQKEPYAFALDKEDFAEPELSQDSLKAIDEAIDEASAGDAQVGCILIDLDTGRGIAANLDEQPYGASSFKGPFCAYLCEMADAGELNIDGVKNSMESVIVYSDNDAYDSLRMHYEGDGLEKWLKDCGITDDEQLSHDWYPFQSSRQSALIWLHINNYLNTGGTNAEWLSGLLGDTSVSFIRDAVGSNNVTVRNKGGWYAASWDDESTWNGTCDAGIIECNGHTYLMSVMTGQPVTERSMENVANLSQALWDAREDLAQIPEEETETAPKPSTAQNAS